MVFHFPPRYHFLAQARFIADDLLSTIELFQQAIRVINDFKRFNLMKGIITFLNHNDFVLHDLLFAWQDKLSGGYLQI